MVVVEDYMAIHQLVARYIHIIDDAAWTDLEEIFTDDGVCDYESFGLPRLEGVESIRAYFAEFEHPIAHYAPNTLILDGGNDDEKILRSKMSLHMRNGKIYSGEYRDRVVRTPAGWRFAVREALPPKSLGT